MDKHDIIYKGRKSKPNSFTGKELNKGIYYRDSL